MKKYLFITLSLFALSFGCDTSDNSTKNSDGTINGACILETAPIINNVEKGTYHVFIYMNKRVDHSMFSDGATKGIYVSKVNGSTLTPVQDDRTHPTNPISGWYTVGSDEIFRWYALSHSDLPSGTYLITIVVGDELVSIYTALWVI